ncbi:MAG: NAD(P)/FAD-dependent oxidoreductase [Anaerolineae bacterium]|nr:NAD(P)/FAD-dependent oxidoreductase [Anaerolineae bacterium]
MPIANQGYAYDAIVVGAGPNGLAAAITLARAGRSVLVLEARDTVGGGTRSAELTLPGYIHDVCSAIHPLGLASPFFKSLPLDQYGLEWIFPPAEIAHPLDDGTAVMIERSIDATARNLGSDGRAYRWIMGPLAHNYDKLLREFLGPLRFPRYPIPMAYFGVLALQPAALLARLAFRGERARAVFSGIAAHAIMPLEWPTTAAFGLMLGMLAHAVGWPLPRGGSQRIADAMASYLASLGGTITMGHPVQSIEELPPARAILFDVTPRQLVQIMGDRLPAGYRRKLEGYRYGPGVCKVDYALDGPIPWRAADCARTATVHLGGTLNEIAASERAVWEGQHPERPFVLLAQQSLFDSTRAPAGKHTVWAYCHVPNGSTVDMSDKITAQIERFAPGFRDRILAKSVRTAVEMERYNANYIGGDITGGVQDIRQLFTRPALRLNPYTTPVKGVYLCSSSTPPGGGVHGMCGYYAAVAALKALR